MIGYDIVDFWLVQVGDAGPLLDMMAATLEKLSVTTLVARSTIQAVSVLALAVAYLPDHLYAHQVPLGPYLLHCTSPSAQYLQHYIKTPISLHYIRLVLLSPSFYC